jgi:hypothetical protein
MSGAPNPRYAESRIGREALRPYIVSVLPLDLMTVWPAADAKAIDQARRDYDAGTHEMCRARADGGTFGQCLILYSIPRRIPARPRKWFGGQ